MMPIALIAASWSTSDRFRIDVWMAKLVSRMAEFAAARFSIPARNPPSDAPIVCRWNEPTRPRADATSVMAVRITCCAALMSPSTRFSAPPDRRSASV